MKESIHYLKKYFGYTEFRSSQKAVIDHVCAGNDALVIMPTGMGKSLCYQIPALMSDGLTVVISPLISLMKDQADSLQRRGIDAIYLNSSLPKSEREKRCDDIASGAHRIIFVSPERFRNARFVDAVRARTVSLLALDEAHCISQWGNDFRPDYACIAEFRAILGNPTTIALTATATAAVQQDIVTSMASAGGVKIFNEGICRPNLTFKTVDIIDEQEKFELLHRAVSGAKGNKIIYFNLIKSIERFAEYCDRNKIRYLIYHGKLSPEKRRTIQNQFIAAENVLVLATNAFGMGIDKSNIRLVVHAEIPDSVEAYYQEIGRAGRDGKPSECLLLYSQDDLAVQIDFLQHKNPDASFIKKCFSVLKSLGESLPSYTYADLQEQIVYKNRGDHRLQTVLSIFERSGVVTGDVDRGTLKVVSDLPQQIVSEEYIREKMDRDKERLVSMLNYAKTKGCRVSYIHSYFGSTHDECGSCDNCR